MTDVVAPAPTPEDILAGAVPKEQQAPPPEKPAEAGVLDAETEAFLARIQPISNTDPWVNLFVYGDGGVGKTVFAASSPGTLVLDCDKSSRSLLNHPALRSTPVLKVHALKDVSKVFGLLLSKHPSFEWVQTVVLDNVTELQKITLKELLVTKGAATGASQAAPTQPDYQQNTDVLRTVMTSFRDLPRNVVVTAHVERDKDGVDGHVFLRPALTPKLAETVEGIFDVLGLMWVEQTDGKLIHKMQVVPSRLVKAKTRIGGLPPVIEEPSMMQVLAANQAWKEQ